MRFNIRNSLISLLGSIIFAHNLNGQDIMTPETGSEEVYAIRWISQFPSEDSVERSEFMDLISGLIFGKKSETVVKPFCVIADDPRTFLILDQGRRTIISNSNGEGEVFRPLRNYDQDFPSLVGLCQTSEKDLLFTDSRLNKIFHISGKDISVFNDSLILLQPTGIAFSSNRQEIWVVETGAHCITVLNMKGELVRKIGERGSVPGTFNFPTFIWIDSSGTVYIVDSMNFRIQIFDGQGTFLASFGENGDATGSMARPKGIATDSRGNIYIADALFHTVQIFDKAGNLLHYFGSQGQGKGEFWMPAGLFIDDHDYIYVADSYNSRVQVFQLVNN